MTLESNKNFGGIGAILMLIGLLPVPGATPYLGIIALVGFILLLFALHGFADYYKESGIFNNSIYGLVAGIVGGVIAGIVVIVSVLTNVKNFLDQVYPGWNGDWSKLSGLTPNTSNITWSTVQPLLEGIILALVVLWIFIIIAAFFARRSLKTLSANAGVGLFSTAGLLLLIGAFLTIVLIGLLLMWIAILLIAIAFFQIQPQPGQPVATTAPPPPTPTPV